MRFPMAFPRNLLPALALVFLPGLSLGEAGILELTLIPTRLERLDELRIPTGRKAILADGSYNMVYDMKRPRADHVFLSFRLDVSIENGTLSLGRETLRLAGEGGGSSYHPFDWFRDLGLDEQRADTLLVRSLGSFEATFEVPRAETDRLALWVGALRVGSVPELLKLVESRTE